MRKLVTEPVVLDDGRDLGFGKLAHMLRDHALLRIENIQDFVVIAVDGGRSIRLFAGRSRCHGHVILPWSDSRCGPMRPREPMFGSPSPCARTRAWPRPCHRTTGRLVIMTIVEKFNPSKMLQPDRTCPEASLPNGAARSM